MEVLHISPVFNRTSILKNGIIPTKIKNESHIPILEERSLSKDGMCVYAWQDCLKNEKFIRDMVYVIVWLHGRNALTMPHDYDWLDFKHVGPIYPYDQMDFDVYVANVPDRESDVVHTQLSVDREWTSYGMNEKYEHDDKVLQVYPHPLKDIRIVDCVSYTYRNKKIEIGVR